MIRQQAFGGYIISCDYCSYDAEVDEVFNFLMVANWIEEQGWGIKREKDKWVHKCPACVEGPQQQELALW